MAAGSGARDLTRIIAAGLRGAGEDVSDENVANMTIGDGAAGYVRIAAALIAATFGGDVPQAENTPRPLVPGPGDD